MKKAQQIPWHELAGELPFEGITRQRVDAEEVTVIRYTYEPGTVFPVHAHPEEQVTIVLSGEIEFVAAGETVLCGPGAVLVIPGGTEHGARVIGDLLVDTINVLSPRRTSDIQFTGGESGA